MARRSKGHWQLQISERRLLLMFGDGVATVISVLLSLRIWALVAGEPFDLNFILPQAFWFALLVFVWYVLASANDFYDLRMASRRQASLIRLSQIMLQLLVVYLIIFFLSSTDAKKLPRFFVLYHAVISFILIGLWRMWKPFLIGWSARRRALVIGTGWAAETILQTIDQEAHKDYYLIGAIKDANDPAQMVGNRPVMGTGLELPAIVDKHDISELILAYGSEQLPGDLFQGIMACYELGITIVPMPILYEQITGRVPIEHIGQQHWTVVLPIEGHSVMFNLHILLKRLIDVISAVIGLVIFLVMLPVIALIMTLDSPGPVFYQQERVGKGGQVYKVYKLRSMIPNAEQHTGPKWASEHDPRITRTGRFFRKTRLDEVPQLYNVLRGEMSIVGPRPERPMFVEQLNKEIPFYRTRLVVKPGLTGWAQVRYKYGNTTEDALIKLQYDLYYIRHQSLALDFVIMLRTAGKMLALGGL